MADVSAFFTENSKEIIRTALSLLAGYLLHLVTQRRPKLVAYLSGMANFQIQTTQGQPNQAIFTHTVTVANWGSGVAEEIQVGHFYLPHFSVVPSVPFTRLDLPDGSSVLKFDSLGAKQAITISYLYFPPNTAANINSYVRSRQGDAQVVPVMQVKIFPPWVYALGWACLLVGAVTIVYWLLGLLL